MTGQWQSRPIGEAWHLWGVIVLGTLVAIPVAVALAAWLGRRRIRAGVEPGWARRSAYAEVLMVVGTVPWLWMTMTPNHDWYRGGNIVPFRDLIHEFQVGIVYALIQVTGNLAVFAALGFGLPIRWRVGPATVLLVAAAGSTTIETLQWVLDLHRYSSIDDVIVNTTGAVVAAWAAWPWWRSRLDVPTRTRKAELAPTAANAHDVTGG